MTKRIIVLNASPRSGGNTETLANALIEGTQQAGNTAEKIDICRLTIHPCKGCYGCAAGKGNPCVQRDDMGLIYAALSQADIIVFASPLYWWQFNAQMKTLIDRLFAWAATNNMQIPQKEVALLIAAEDARAENFAQIIPYYETCLVQNLNWVNRGMILAGGVNMPGDIEKTSFLEKAAELGASL